MNKPGDAAWLADFHAGSRATLERCYREHCPSVLRAMARMLNGADAETVTHELFYRLLTNPKLRKSFQGGHFDAWLRQVATNAARDLLRRQRREEPEESAPMVHAQTGAGLQNALADDIEAKALVARFRSERLPPAWAGVFDARFLRQLPQRRAAQELGIPRTTLVYQEQRVRALLRDFLLHTDES
ncbi:MAG: sigma-70 family RNA polymerase sigma factor [Myxococcota bacterium]|nr:sigma-70 family RNA polymerase sigma factor [Myxococcota bacterium]